MVVGIQGHVFNGGLPAGLMDELHHKGLG